MKALSAVIGREILFVEQSVEEARAQMLRFMPQPVVDGTLAILGAPTAEEQRVGVHVPELLGRPAARFSEWAARNAELFRT